MSHARFRPQTTTARKTRFRKGVRFQTGQTVRLLVYLLAACAASELGQNQIAAQDTALDQSRFTEDELEFARNPALGMPTPGGQPRMAGSFSPPAPSKPIEPLVPAPDWMEIGLEKQAAYSRLRTLLRTKVEVDFQHVPLRTLLKNLAMQTGVDFFVNVSELDLLGVDPETPVTVRYSDIPVEVALNLILDPLELSMRFTEAGVEITSLDAAENDPQVRYYDAAWVIAETGQLDSLMNVIQQCIDPDSWLMNGGTSTILPIGQVLVVAAPPTTQIKIEEMLGNLAKFRPKSNQPATAKNNDAQPKVVEQSASVSETSSPAEGNQ